MKLIEKLKNVFFEEVDEDEELPQTYAKKVEIPKRHVEVVSKEKEDDVEEKEEKVEKVEPIKPNVKPNDNDDLGFEFKPRDLIREEKKEEHETKIPMMYDVDDFLEDKNSHVDEVPFNNVEETPQMVYRRERERYDDDDTERELYQGKKEISYIESVRKPNYTYTKSYYEERETKGFKPSPIISPIYGILDKNYRKEEVVTKKETRITSSYKKPDLDSVRNKAFGSEEEETREVPKREEKHVEDKRVYDVNSNKPQVNRVTLADADEYYNDLGLAYNVDYSDASRTNAPKTSKYSRVEKKKTNVDDNLFDLIDSMYNKED